jgi:predicted PolB exonuclease-like 3'-5' exonuclease
MIRGVFKTVLERVWAFDCEWVPDPVAGRVLYDVAESEPRDLLEVMWHEGGASEEDPTPFLKTILCRIVAISAVERRLLPDGEVTLQLLSLPHDPDDPADASERAIVGAFLDAVGKSRPQLVGFNSIDSDLRILVQRAVVLGLQAPGFARRPEKPWQGVDYFARQNDWNVDLKQVLGGWGKAVPSLHEAATLSGIPGKMEVDGNQVAQLWLDGRLREIVDYNQFDALTTYLLWLRVAHFGGHFTSEEYALEQERVRDLLERRSAEAGGGHLRDYLAEWDRLREALEPGRGATG